MIFWFRAKEGIFSLAAFVFWIMLIAVLAVILFNEGLSFSETAKNSSYKVFQSVPDTLHVRAGNKFTGQANEKELNFSEHGYNIVNDDRKELHIRPFLKVCDSEKENPRIELGNVLQDAVRLMP